MFLAAAPYFHRRFQENQWAVEHYESSILSVSTITNLLCVLVLAKLQQNASYPLRIASSLVILTVVFSFLALSTVLFRALPVGIHFVFVMTMVLGASFATGMNQNGVFAFVSGFGRPEYTQAIMVGQGVSGVLPCIVQIMTNLSVSRHHGGHDDEEDHHGRGDGGYYKSALAYFSVAVLITIIALLAFVWLMNRTAGSRWFMKEIQASRRAYTIPATAAATEAQAPSVLDKSVGLWQLFLRLKWLALAVYASFTVTMVYPVFTSKITSVHNQDSVSMATRSRLFEPEVFIPLAFLFWNLGDLVGRLSPIVPSLARSAKYPRALFAFSLCRILFVPLYLACNIRGAGEAAINSDFVYLFIIQLGFGLTNGFLGSVCMMGAGQYVTADEREAAGGFMSMMLVAGLATGSLLSFVFSGI
jgi:solute carrier family 29 (equilibrative nucleoside transporter), member 1/2/3